ADMWKRLGVGTETVRTSPQQLSDRPYMWTFPGFMTLRQGSTITSLANYRSSQAPVPENNYVGGNYGRYMNADLDTLIQRYFVTIPRQERAGVLRTIVQ